jgi:hypothetical protein
MYIFRVQETFNWATSLYVLYFLYFGLCFYTIFFMDRVNPRLDGASSTFYSRRWPPLPPTYLNLDNGTLPHITFASTTDLLHPAPISSTLQSCGSASSQSNRTKWHHSFSDFLCAPFLKCLSEFKNSTHFKSYHCILCPRTTLTWKSLS